MTWGRLRAFVAVADLGSVHAAAAALTVSEPAVSAAVAALQRQVGEPLVQRHGRGLRLTPAGLAYADYARRILGLLEEGRQAARSEGALEAGRLRVAAVTSAGEHVVPALLAGFRQRHPTLTLGLEVGTRARVWALLRDHAVDVAVAGRPPGGLGLVTRAVRENTLAVVGAPEYAAAPDLRDVPWLMREPGSGTRETTEGLLEALQADPPRLTLGSNGAVVAGAVAGLGVTLASLDAVRAELADSRLAVLPVPGTPLDRPYHVVTHRAAPPVARAFVDYLLADGGPATGAGFTTAGALTRRIPRAGDARKRPRA